MIGVVHDFENWTLTSFPTTFEPLEVLGCKVFILFVNVHVNFS